MQCLVCRRLQEEKEDLANRLCTSEQQLSELQGFMQQLLAACLQQPAARCAPPQDQPCRATPQQQQKQPISSPTNSHIEQYQDLFYIQAATVTSLQHQHQPQLQLLPGNEENRACGKRLETCAMSVSPSRNFCSMEPSHISAAVSETSDMEVPSPRQGLCLPVATPTQLSACVLPTCSTSKPGVASLAVDVVPDQHGSGLPVENRMQSGPHAAHAAGTTNAVPSSKGLCISDGISNAKKLAQAVDEVAAPMRGWRRQGSA